MCQLRRYLLDLAEGVILLVLHLVLDSLELQVHFDYFSFALCEELFQLVDFALRHPNLLSHRLNLGTQLVLQVLTPFQHL